MKKNFPKPIYSYIQDNRTTMANWKCNIYTYNNLDENKSKKTFKLGMKDFSKFIIPK